MIQLTSNEIDDINRCKRELEAILQTLDDVGAGIAAIHVNAAVEQLKSNLAVVTPEVGSKRSAFYAVGNLG